MISWANLRGPSRYLAACVAATRPKSLTAAVIPFAVGTSLACAAGPPRWPHAVPAFAAFVLMQVGCNLVNDACDFTRGADGPRRVGPTRVSQAGVFRPGTVHLCGVFTLALSMVAVAPAALDLEYEGGLVFAGFAGSDRIQWAVVLLAVTSAAASRAHVARASAGRRGALASRKLASGFRISRTKNEGCARRRGRAHS